MRYGPAPRQQSLIRLATRFGPGAPSPILWVYLAFVSCTWRLSMSCLRSGGHCRIHGNDMSVANVLYVGEGEEGERMRRQLRIIAASCLMLAAVASSAAGEAPS